MKQGLQSLSWIVEQAGGDSVVCLLPDIKGRLVELILKGVKKRLFRYTGVGIPHPVISKLSKDPKHSGFVIETLDEPQPSNASIAICTPETYPLVWHCPVVVVWGDRPPNQAFTKIVHMPGEPAMWFWPQHRIPQRRFEVKTRNCVDDRIIQTNVINSLNLGLPCLPRVSAHGERALIFGGGPSIVNHIETVRHHAQAPGNRLCCVKSSHDMLIAAGVVPWVCLLLDPRSHVKDFVEEPHPNVLYFVSSTCNPTTFDRLLSRGANVWLYHALVGASEDSLVKMHLETLAKQRRQFQDYCKQLGVPPMPVPEMGVSDQMVAGGTTAGSRGLSVLHMLGFRNFSLYGFDSCYFEPKDLSEKKDNGEPRWQHLNIGGKNFYTDAELVAQVQDFRHILNGAMPDCHFDIVGEGMVAALFKGHRALPLLHEVFPQ